MATCAKGAGHMDIILRPDRDGGLKKSYAGVSLWFKNKGRVSRLTRTSRALMDTGHRATAHRWTRPRRRLEPQQLSAEHAHARCQGAHAAHSCAHAKH
eukprot:158278-Chlamydomonas_euryale.AAC.3